jgi:hypothetical protein
MVVTLTLSACGAGGHAPSAVDPATGSVVRTAIPSPSTPSGAAGAVVPGSQVSPSTASISQDDVTELRAALGDAESLTNDVESDMAKDASQ